MSNSLDRQTDRRKYDLEDTPRSEGYRSGPDGGIGDREPMSATLPRYSASRQMESEYRERSRTPDPASYNTYAIETEWHRYDRERRRRNDIPASKSCTELSKPAYTDPAYKEAERSSTYQQDGRSAPNFTDSNRGKPCQVWGLVLKENFQHEFSNFMRVLLLCFACEFNSFLIMRVKLVLVIDFRKCYHSF